MVIDSINYLWVSGLARCSAHPFLAATFQLAPIDILATVVFFWHYVQYVTLIPVGYTIVIFLIVSVMGRLVVHLR